MAARSFWWTAVGIIVIVIGVILLLGALGIDIGNALGVVVAVVIILVGVWLLWRRRPGPAAGRDTFAGSVRMGGPGWKVETSRHSITFGEMRLDLTQSDIPAGEHRLDLDAFMGSVVVTVPKDVGVSATGHAFLGAVNLLGQRADGIDRSLSVTSPGYAEAAKKLIIDVSTFAGDVRVQYAP